jgi:hypothetical protein
MLLDIVTYQLTDAYGVKAPPYHDTTAVAFSFSGSHLTLARVAFDGDTVSEQWTLVGGALRGSRRFDNFVGRQVGPFATSYTASHRF